MKRFLAFSLVFVMALSLCACGAKIDEETQKKLDLYDKYENYIDLLEDGKYEKLIEKLIEKNGNQIPGGESDPDVPGNNEEPTVPSEPAEPTEEERHLLKQYYEIVDCLYYYEQGNGLYVEEYNENGDYIAYHSDQAALQFCLQKLQELTVADEWTEWLQNYYNYGYDYNWNRQELLRKFSVVSDVPLKQLKSTTDHMGNVSDLRTQCAWSYNADGTVARIDSPANIVEQIETNPYDIGYNAYYTYDANGLVSDVRYSYADTTYFRVTPSYDANGSKISEHVVNNDGETDITYTYNDQGQLTQINWKRIASSGTNNYSYNIYYTYNASGNVVKEEKVYSYFSTSYSCDIVSEKWITEYAYDANGHLTTGTYTYEKWSYDTEGTYNEDIREWTYEVIPYVSYNKQDKYTYTCDEQGRVLAQNIEYGNSYYQYGDNAGQLYSKSDYTTGVIEFVYGDYVFYNVE